MSFITTLAVAIFCFHAATATVQVSGIFNSDTGEIINTEWLGPDESECEDNAPCSDIIQQNQAALDGKNLVQEVTTTDFGFVQAFTQMLFGIQATISNTLIAVLYPTALLQNMCEEFADDPDATGVCSKDEGVGRVFGWLHNIIWLNYIFLILQFFSNRSLKGMS